MGAARPQVEVADVIRAHGQAYLDATGSSLTLAQERVLRDLAACRTAALGGHLEECTHCGHERPAYDSCRNRHCPKCQASNRREWYEAREGDLLPVEYFHVVFTVPQAIARIALQNKRVVYQILFRGSADTLRQIAADPRHLGAEIGLLSVLHTWGQTLTHHPHVHCVVPGGGLSPDGSRWISCPRGFFLPAKVLSPVFRGKFLEELREAFDAGRLSLDGQLAHLNDPKAFHSYLSSTYKSDWVVYSKPPFGGPEQVLKYLARYTHRIAISNWRLLSHEHGKVSFTWKDYANGNRTRVMTLEASEFLRRFLLHVLPSGFVRIRHYGFLANRARATKLQLCRDLLGVSSSPGSEHPTSEPAEGADTSEDRDHGSRCPRCKQGRMIPHVLPKRPELLLQRALPPPSKKAA